MESLFRLYKTNEELSVLLVASGILDYKLMVEEVGVIGAVEFTWNKDYKIAVSNTFDEDMKALAAHGNFLIDHVPVFCWEKSMPNRKIWKHLKRAIREHRKERDRDKGSEQFQRAMTKINLNELSKQTGTYERIARVHLDQGI